MVIAIIAILAAIPFPVFAQAREMARITSCGPNLVLADGHVKSYTASSILGQEQGANLIWRIH